MIGLYEKRTSEYPDTLVMQLAGMFYVSWDYGAIVLSSITGYKLVETDSGRLKCGFPSGKTTDKVKRKLDHERINYIFFDGTTASGHKCYSDNHYREPEFLKKAEEAKISLTQKAVSENINCNEKKPSSVQADEDIKEFLICLRDGKHPFTQKRCNTLNLNDPAFIRKLAQLIEKWNCQ